MKQLLLISMLLLSIAATSHAQLSLAFETGAVFNGYNTVRNPPTDGTLLSFTKDLKGHPAFHYRFTIEYVIKERHHIIALIAPLQMTYTGIVNK